MTEYGDYLKIGRTRNPLVRLQALESESRKKYSKSIGRIALSDNHRDYYASERVMQKQFSKYRIAGTELFTIGFDEAVALKPQYNISENELIVQIPLCELSNLKDKCAKLEEVNYKISEELRFAKKIAEALGFDWTKFYEEASDSARQETVVETNQ